VGLKRILIILKYCDSREPSRKRRSFFKDRLCFSRTFQLVTIRTQSTPISIWASLLSRYFCLEKKTDLPVIFKFSKNKSCSWHPRAPIQIFLFKWNESWSTFSHFKNSVFQLGSLGFSGYFWFVLYLHSKVKRQFKIEMNSAGVWAHDFPFCNNLIKFITYDQRDNIK
jgi:hypothetical protein